MGMLKTLYLLILLLLFMAFGHHYRPLVVGRFVPVGAVIQDSDICRTGEVWTMRTEDYAEERSLVVGHKAVHPLHPGGDFHLSDVSQ